MNILALDPGPVQCGWATLINGRLTGAGILPNSATLDMVRSVGITQCTLVIEMIASYGMPVGAEVFDTCVWIGRYKQTWFDPDAVRMMFRKDVKVHLCGTAKAKDGNIRQALIDRLGPPGTKKKPGPTFGITGDAWAAVAVAITAQETPESKRNETAGNPRKRLAPDSKPRRRISLEPVPVARQRVRV